MVSSGCAHGTEGEGWERSWVVSGSTLELVHHAREFRPPPARSREPPKDVKQDIIRFVLTYSSGNSTENGLEGIRLEAQERVRNLHNCPFKKG